MARNLLHVTPLLVIFAGIMSCGTPKPAPGHELSLEAQVGRKLFYDKTLSASGRLACSTCHDPQHAFGPPNALAVQLGGLMLSAAGFRAVPTLTYKSDTPPFNESTLRGGFNWDGRASSFAQQAETPLLSSFEMANASPADVVRKIRIGPSRALFQQAFGSNALDDPKAGFKEAAIALATFQTEAKEFHEHTAKYDQAAEGKAYLSQAEERGRQLFMDSARGDCAACHPPPRFTSFGYAAIGIPRNMDIPANADTSFHDLGLCGPTRLDVKQKSRRLCGMFKVPTLRNVSTRKVFFHNGGVRSLFDAVAVSVSTQAAADIPAEYLDNIFRPELVKPMTRSEIKDVVCFLKTLTDGYVGDPVTSDCER